MDSFSPTSTIEIHLSKALQLPQWSCSVASSKEETELREEQPVHFGFAWVTKG